MVGVTCKKKKEYMINCCSQSRFLPHTHTKNADELESDNATADYAKEGKFISLGENNLNLRD